MIPGRQSSLVLLYEAVGFLAIVALSWLNELIGLPSVIFGGLPHQTDFRESAMETIVVLVVAAPILLLSRRLLSRLFYLERFLKMCAWCKRVDTGESWVPIDTYLAAGYGQRTTHGICPDCYERVKSDIP